MRKIMSYDELRDTVNRLTGCVSLIYLISEVAEQSDISAGAMRGLGDLLAGICNDFKASISDSENHDETDNSES